MADEFFDITLSDGSRGDTSTEEMPNLYRDSLPLDSPQSKTSSEESTVERNSKEPITKSDSHQQQHSETDAIESETKMPTQVPEAEKEETPAMTIMEIKPKVQMHVSDCRH